MKRMMMLFGMMLASCAAMADTEIVDGIEWTYTISDGEASVGGGEDYSAAIPTETTGAITVPSTLGGCPVTSIGDAAFNWCVGLTSVTIPSSVTSIGDNAFWCCSGLTSVTIPSSVTSIGEGAFGECRGLTSVAIPSSVTSIGDYAFYYCSGLTSVTIPSSVTSIGEIVFVGCSGLKSINVAKDNAAYTSQDGVLFNKRMTELVGFPSGKTGAYVIPSSVTSIGDSAFYCCYGLTSVTIPKGVTSIGGLAFSGCSGLKSIDVAKGNSAYTSQSGVLFDKSMTELLCFPGGETGAYVIPSSVTSIGGSAFSSCSGLTSVTIPEGVTSIGGGVFFGCSGLTSVTIPTSVMSIGEFAFSMCSGLTSVTIPSSVTSIEACAFDYCEKLKTVYVEKGDTARVKGLYEWDSGISFVEGAMPTPEPENEFDGSVSHTFNGLVYDADGVMCGMAQITTAKATKNGVKVGGFVMLADGKKQTVKAATVPIENGQLNVTTKAGKTDLTLTITGDGFTGTMDDMTLASEDVDEDTGILSGTLKMSYFDAKTGKVKTKSITIGGVASGGEAVGTATVKGQGAKSFAAEVE